MFFLHMQGQKDLDQIAGQVHLLHVFMTIQSLTDFLIWGKQRSCVSVGGAMNYHFVESPTAILVTVSLISEQTMHKFVRKETPPWSLGGYTS